MAFMSLVLRVATSSFRSGWWLSGLSAPSGSAGLIALLLGSGSVVRSCWSSNDPADDGEVILAGCGVPSDLGITSAAMLGGSDTDEDLARPVFKADDCVMLDSDRRCPKPLGLCSEPRCCDQPARVTKLLQPSDISPPRIVMQAARQVWKRRG